MTGPGPRPSAVARELARYVRPGPGPTTDPGVGWEAMLGLADQHRLVPAVGAALRSRGVPELPPAFIEHGASPLAVVQRAHAANAARVVDLRGQLRVALAALDGAGIEAVSIKGAHWLLTGAHRDLAARVTIDLDLLIAPGEAAAAVAALQGVGYRHEREPDHLEPTDHQLAPLYLPGHAGSIEVHREPMVAFRRRLLTADQLRATATTVTVDGAPRRVPDPTSMVVLLVGHAMLQDDGVRLLALPLRALHDLAMLDPAALAGVEWDRLARTFAAAGPGGRMALASFGAAAELLGVELPIDRRGGRSWLRAAAWSLDHPVAGRRFQQAAYLPRALRTERMQRLYGVDTPVRVWLARARHVTRSRAG